MNAQFFDKNASKQHMAQRESTRLSRKHNSSVFVFCFVLFYIFLAHLGSEYFIAVSANR